MRTHRLLVPALLAATCIAACSDRAVPAGGAASPAEAPASAVVANVAAKPQLRMLIDGKPWMADQAIEAMVQPPGFDRAVLINGSLGPKDANEQAFSIILLGIDGPGTHHLKSGSPERGVIQMANLNARQYLAGNILGYDVSVDVLRYSARPVLVEARFSGSLTASDSSTLAITEGYFRYAE